MSQYAWMCLNNAEYNWICWHWEYCTLKNISSKTQGKEAPQGNVLEFFILNTLKTTSWIKNSTQWWIQSGLFFPNSGHFFRFSKRGGEDLLSPPWLRACECSWIWIKYLNILENAWINIMYIFVTVIILESFSASILSFFSTS